MDVFHVDSRMSRSRRNRQAGINRSTLEQTRDREKLPVPRSKATRQFLVASMPISAFFVRHLKTAVFGGNLTNNY
jgi:hypothetical protein